MEKKLKSWQRKKDILTLCKKHYSRKKIIKNFGFDKNLVIKILKGKRC